MITILPQLGDLYLGSLAAPDGAALLQEAIIRRFTSPGGWITLFILLAISLGIVLRMASPRTPAEPTPESISTGENGSPLPKAQADFFSLILIDMREFHGDTIRGLMAEVLPRMIRYGAQAKAAGGIRQDVEAVVLLQPGSK